MSSKPLLDIGDKEWHIVEAILQRYVPDREVWAFGSRAKWTAKEFSDLDLAILGEKSLTLDESATLSDAFAESDLPWKVDVVEWATTSPSFRKIIKRDKVVVQLQCSSKFETLNSDVTSEWRVQRLDQIADINPMRKVRKGDVVPFVDMAALPQLSRDISTDGVIAREAKGSGAHFQNGDTLLARITPCLENGKTAQVRCLENNVIAEGSTEFIVLCGKEASDNDFIYYLCREPTFRKYAIGRMEGTSGRQRVSWQSIAAYEFPLPPPDRRREIARVLSALDDRISLLRETNTTLEAVAQALFKSWFVDFDPVCAKMQGRVPEGMDDATAALFPDSFEELGVKPAPKGWHQRKLGDVCSYLNRGISPKYLETGGVLVINQKCIRDFSIDYEKARRHDPVQRKIDGRQLMIGDVLVNSTGVGTLGRVAQVLALPEIAIVDSHVTVVRAGESLTWSYLGQWMIRMQPEIEAMGEGSTGQTELARSKLSELSIFVPGSEVLSAFDSIVLSLKQRIAVNEASASELIKLRDTLLPRLISGQICVQNMEPIT